MKFDLHSRFQFVERNFFESQLIGCISNPLFFNLSSSKKVAHYITHPQPGYVCMYVCMYVSDTFLQSSLSFSKRLIRREVPVFDCAARLLAPKTKSLIIII